MALPLAAKAALWVAGESRALAKIAGFVVGVALVLVLVISTLFSPLNFLFRPSRAALQDIPRAMLALYQEAAALYGLDWTILAAIGKIESDHARSNAPGVHSGQNAHGCCAGPMQFFNNRAMAGGPTTWDRYGNGGDVYDPHDSIMAAARYLRAAGDPDGDKEVDYNRAIFAYNHAGWYVQEVLAQADAYRGPPEGGDGYRVGADGDWLAALPSTVVAPGRDGAACDARIVPDVIQLSQLYGLRITACYERLGHAPDGEHPMGLAIDAHPVDGDWSRAMRLARDFGWSESCASSGCAGRLEAPFRFVGYNGYRDGNHGDPAHTSKPHIHLSWNHSDSGAGRRQQWVQTLRAPAPRGTTA